MSNTIHNVSCEKHAYLIMCHNNFSVLETSLRLLDNIRNDVYIHIDKKIKNFDKLKFLNICRYAKVFFTKKRYNVKWGTCSQALVEIYLFKYAFLNKKENYSYYHLISGSDLPLKNQEQMYKFFDNHNDIFLECDNEFNIKRKYERVSLYHFNNARFDTFICNLQRKIKMDRIKKYNMTFYTGANWCSLPNYAVEYLLKKEKFIKKLCRFSICADECYKQFIIFNSPFAKKIYRNKNGHTDNLRAIYWASTNDRKHPHTYNMNDKDLLINSEKFFARKFDENTCPQIINFIYDFITKNASEKEHN